MCESCDRLRKALEPFAEMANAKGMTPEGDKLRAVLDAMCANIKPGDTIDVIRAFCDAVLAARAALTSTPAVASDDGKLAP